MSNPQPDNYMPFEGDKFMQAVDGQPSYVCWAYLKIIWHYWSHTKCTGLKDDKRFLRKLSDAENDEQWDDIEEFVFDGVRCFHQDRLTNLWKNKSADERWQRQVALINKRKGQTAAASAARWSERRPLPKRKI